MDIPRELKEVNKSDDKLAFALRPDLLEEGDQIRVFNGVPLKGPLPRSLPYMLQKNSCGMGPAPIICVLK